MKKTVCVVASFILAAGAASAQDGFRYTISGGFDIVPVLQTNRSRAPLADFLEGGVQYDWTGPIKLSATIGVHRWNDPDLNLIHPAVDVPLLVGLQWHIIHSPLTPFISTEAGVHFVSRTYYRNTMVQAGENLWVSTATDILHESVMRFGYRIGLGLSVAVNDQFRIDAGARAETIVWHVASDLPVAGPLPAPTHLDAVMSFSLAF